MQIKKTLFNLFKNRKKSKFDIKNAQNILISARCKIGDTIVLFPLLREMKKNNPNLNIDILAIRHNSFMFKHNENVNNIYMLYKGISFFTKSLPNLFKLRKNNYDVIIDTFPIKFESFFYLHLINAKLYLTENFPNRYALDLNELNYFDFLLEQNRTLYMSKSLLRYLEPFGYKCFDNSLEVYTTEEKQKYAKDFFKPYKEKRIIAINVLGSAKSRCITAQDYIYIAKEILKIENTIIFFITMPQNILEVKNNIKDIPNMHLAYETKDIFDVIALVGEVDLLISPDTALVHIGSALKKDTIGIYSNIEINRTWWYDPESTVTMVKSKHELVNSIEGFDRDEVILNANKLLH